MGNHRAEAWEGEGVSRNVSEPIGASLLQVGSGQPSHAGETWNRSRSNEQRQRPGSPGWSGTAGVDRSIEEPERPGQVAWTRAEFGQRPAGI